MTTALAIVEAEQTPASAALAKINALKDALNLRFYERSAVIDGLALALVARANVFILGEPGTAKSAVVDAFCEAIEGRFFSTLCNRFQPPEEVLGMLSLKGMQEDRYVRRTTNRLPEADVAFLDELFKGSAALLNTLLRITNEHVFEQDGVVTAIPARLIVGASNELPADGDGLGAFYDRFLLRYDVKRLQDDRSVSAMLFSQGLDAELPRVAMADIDTLSAEAERVAVSKDAVDAVLKIRTALHDKSVRVSDRRWKQAAGLLKADAALHGQSAVTSASLTVLEHCLWDRPEQVATVREIVRAHVATWIKMTRDAHAAIDEQASRIQQSSKQGGPKHEAIAQLGKALDAVTDVAHTMEELLSTSPEAREEVEAVRARIKKTKNDIASAMRLHGIGV